MERGRNILGELKEEEKRSRSRANASPVLESSGKWSFFEFISGGGWGSLLNGLFSTIFLQNPNVVNSEQNPLIISNTALLVHESEGK